MKNKLWRSGVLSLAAAMAFVFLVPAAACAAGFDAAEVNIYAAGEYREGFAPILFSHNDLLYKGYIDRDGRLVFYHEYYDQEDHDREVWVDLHLDFQEMNSAYFDNGYSWFDHGGMRYIIDTSGQVLSSYQLENVVCTGGGYTWVGEAGESSWDNAGEYTYTLYRPDGQTETSYAVEQDGGDRTEDEMHYIGGGVFADRLGYHYYATKTSKWTEKESEGYVIDYSNSTPENLSDYKYLLREAAGQDNETYPSYVILLDADGELQRRDIALDRGWMDPNALAMSDKYIVFEQQRYGEFSVMQVYDMENGGVVGYQGEFADHICSWMTSDRCDVNDERLVFAMNGDDGKCYLAVVRTDDMSEAGEPIQMDSEDSFYLGDDYFVVFLDGVAKAYDLDCEPIGEYRITGDVRYDDGDASVRYFDDLRWAEYIKPDGSLLFPAYDFSDAVDLLAGLDG